MVLSIYKWVMVAHLLLTGFSGSNKAIGAHPFYMSVTEINHNAKDQTLEISCKIFTNDFETSLSKLAKSKIDLSDTRSKTKSDQLITAYVQSHLQIKVDGRPVNLQFVGSEKETDATWIYFQVNNIPSVKKMEITNSLLYESFEAEINIVHVTVNGVRKSSKLTNPDTKLEFEF